MVLTLTVGIGINASVFTVVNGMVLRPHVYKDPATFVRIFPETRAAELRAPRLLPRIHCASATRTARCANWPLLRYFPVMIGDDDSVSSAGMTVSCNFFLVDGLDRPSSAACSMPATASARAGAGRRHQREGLAHRVSASDPDIVGRVIRVNSRPVTIVGVVPDRTAGWTRPAQPSGFPTPRRPTSIPSRNVFERDDVLWLTPRRTPRARLLAQPGPRRIRHPRAAAGSLRIPAAAPSSTTTDGSWIEEFDLHSLRRAISSCSAFFLGVLHLVLLISCANVATLLLSRAAARRREIAVRLSLGAPRVRLVRMLVTESLLLAALAGAASVYLVLPRAASAVPLHLAPKAPDFPMTPDWRIFAYIAAIVLLTGILSGLAPALESVKVDLAARSRGTAACWRGGGRVCAASWSPRRSP